MANARWRDTYEVVEFSIECDGKRVICWISEEALADHFGATKASAVAVLLANMGKIAPVAEKLYRATPSGELVMVKTEHF